MKDNQPCKPANRFLKARIILGVCILLGASCLSVRAADSAAQAAARAALQQKLNELDHPQTSVPPVPVTPYVIVIKHRGIYAAHRVAGLWSPIA